MSRRSGDERVGACSSFLRARSEPGTELGEGEKRGFPSAPFPTLCPGLAWYVGWEAQGEGSKSSPGFQPPPIGEFFFLRKQKLD